MGRFFRAIRGFFGSLLTGVEQRNPEILLETAVQDELNNLKKLQVAAARTMAYEKMLTNDAASKQKVVTVKERQARELAVLVGMETCVCFRLGIWKTYGSGGLPEPPSPPEPQDLEIQAVRVPSAAAPTSISA